MVLHSLFLTDNNEKWLWKTREKNELLQAQLDKINDEMTNCKVRSVFSQQSLITHCVDF